VSVSRTPEVDARSLVAGYKVFLPRIGRGGALGALGSSPLFVAVVSLHANVLNLSGEGSKNAGSG
jgi:hypothetical protein